MTLLKFLRSSLLSLRLHDCVLLAFLWCLEKLTPLINDATIYQRQQILRWQRILGFFMQMFIFVSFDTLKKSSSRLRLCTEFNDTCAVLHFILSRDDKWFDSIWLFICLFACWRGLFKDSLVPFMPCLGLNFCLHSFWCDYRLMCCWFEYLWETKQKQPVNVILCKIL